MGRLGEGSEFGLNGGGRGSQVAGEVGLCLCE